MIFSSLTQTELETAYAGMKQTLDFPQIFAGHVRHEIDWLYGINLTRALTLAIKKAAGWFKIVSTGRVQGPVLAYVAQRDREINVFVPTPYWNIVTVGNFENQEVYLEYNLGRVSIKREADKIILDNHYSAIKKLSPPLVDLPTYSLIHKRHKALIPALAKALKEMKQDGLFTKIEQDTLKQFNLN